METVYYHLDARRIAADGLASGGEDAPAVSYALLPRRSRPAPGGDKVLDFNACRRKLEAAGRIEAPEEEAPAEVRRARPAAGREEAFARRLGLLLDFCATAAVVIFTVLAAARFLGAF